MSWFRRTAGRVKKGRGYASQSRRVDDAVTRDYNTRNKKHPDLR